MPSRVIFTARLNLGAAAAQLIRVSGLEISEFEDFVSMTAQEMGLPLTALGAKRDLQRFHKVTDGSPIFATSILRLVELGDNLGSALERWRGNDGEHVRAFAFERELQTLTESQIRTARAMRPG